MLNSPHDVRDENYLNYDDRLKQLKLIKINYRRKINYVVLIIRILRSQINTQYNDFIIRLHQQAINRRRRGDVININHNLIAPNTPLHFGIIDTVIYSTLMTQFN